MASLKVRQKLFFVSTYPRRLSVANRARPLGIDVIVGDHQTFAFDQHDKRAESSDHFCLQFLGYSYPASDGTIYDRVLKTHAAGALVSSRPRACTKPPGEFGADIAVVAQLWSHRYGGPSLLHTRQNTSVQGVLLVYPDVHGNSATLSLVSISAVKKPQQYLSWVLLLWLLCISWSAGLKELPRCPL